MLSEVLAPEAVDRTVNISTRFGNNIVDSCTWVPPQMVRLLLNLPSCYVQIATPPVPSKWNFIC